MVSKHALSGVVEELARVLPGAGQTAQDTVLQHIRGTVPLEHPRPHATAHLLHHVALGLEFSASHRETGSGHDPGLFVAESQDLVHRVEATADPRAGEKVERRIVEW